MFAAFGTLRRLLTSRRNTVSPTGRPSVSLRLEELEHRWVPSAVVTSSSNWAGYAVATGPGAVTAVSGSWTVPTVTGTPGLTTYSSAWVGIDGYNSSTVEQTGTEMDVSSRGVAQYSAWYEMFPNSPVTIPTITVHPGDKITASVKYAVVNNIGDFILTITDGSQTFATTQKAAGEQISSAEWIAEAPSSNRGVLPLANFGAVTFSNASATVKGTAGAIDHGWQNTTLYEINLANSQAQAKTSGLADLAGASSFAVGYGASVPATPSVAPPTPPTPPAPPPAHSTGLSAALTGTVNSQSRAPAVDFVATLTPGAGQPLPTGIVEVMDGNTVIGTVQIQIVNGVAKAVFTVTFPRQAGVYHISIVYPGSSGNVVSNTITVTVP